MHLHPSNFEGVALRRLDPLYFDFHQFTTQTLDMCQIDSLLIFCPK
jgi:hypothetical protein